MDGRQQLDFNRSQRQSQSPDFGLHTTNRSTPVLMITESLIRLLPINAAGLTHWPASYPTNIYWGMLAVTQSSNTLRSAL